MSRAGPQKAQFFELHPWCCFCGGIVPATTEDHQPARIFFRDRNWPEGFVFPACDDCNQASRESENLVSILIADSAPSSRKGYQTRAASIRHNHPRMIPSLLSITANQKRRALKNMFVELLTGQAHANLPMVKVEPELWASHLELIGRKIMLALHYQTFGNPLPSYGRVWLNIMTNGSNLESDWFKSVRDMTGRFVFPVRSGKSLLDQFTLQWDVLEGHKVAIYLVTLQKRVIFTGLTTEEPELHVFPDENGIFPPLTAKPPPVPPRSPSPAP